MPDRDRIDPVSLAVFSAAVSAVAEEMGAALQRSSFSPNIKERLDFSCAVFDEHGRLIAQAAHIPAHLGSMPDSVRVVLEQCAPFAPGDVVVVNDPYLGGNHLPDITMVSPVFLGEEPQGELIGFVANRAHHADVGGISPGSMPIATELFQEGIIIPPIKLWERGQLNQAALALILRNVRTPDERRGDLMAQFAANRTGVRRVLELVARYGLVRYRELCQAVLDYGERLARQAIRAIPPGTYRFTDYLDDDGISDEPVPITVTVEADGETLTFDFTGTTAQRPGSINTVETVTKSAAYYVLRCLMPEDAPMNHGVFRVLRVIAPAGTVVNARPPCAVAGGNVETSQRIVDVLFGALAQALPDTIPAASQGTMNNLTIGGIDPETGRPFAYYETMGGGMGARPGLDGLSAVHVHMSNTRNTPIEALEYAYPFRIVRYALREGSGGQGAARGGDGLIREIEFLAEVEVTLLTERRRLAPWGLQGGQPGALGRNILVRRTGAGLEEVDLGGKRRLTVRPGDRLRIETPGGGGWGRVQPEYG
ncbi:hydantoinase B/oxoprolinase family protein [Thermomicrobium sp. 4228-Ro]|uniref:hydantoinase B/oxoprolinase family protein n=1 Tax=Thermomicrobium sp. 4228-Ro TaxID=2993937 RepID=UPI002249562D|nr:hydantoinase B/oxoprolinase family protein [Thermomicrobium sp. 4228-Ro]MCX2728475.1 hydantoinase B/oxoprolinase family protein [Thermomicrobium sp. 4228-Ro]